MQTSYLKGIKNIVFDLGGVIITLEREEAVRRFEAAGLTNARELLDAYHQKGIFLQLEEGTLSREDFYDAVRKEAGQMVTNEAIDYGWMGFLKEIPQHKLQMLEDLRARGYKLYLLSNTNPIIMQWAFTSNFSPAGKTIEDYFDKLYLSYKIGYTKPDERIFDFMLRDSGMNPSETLFIDDGAANVEAGKRCGMSAYLAVNGEDFRHIFE